jgi:dynein heavy chain
MIQDGNKKIPSYWESSKKLLADRMFLKKLIGYNKDDIPEHVISRVRNNYISQTAIFNAKRVEKASSAAKGLCEWILALDEYDRVLKMVRPK